MAKAKKVAVTKVKKTPKQKPKIVVVETTKGGDYDRKSGKMLKTIFTKTTVTKDKNKSKASRTVQPNTLGAKQQAKYSKYLRGK